MSGANQLWNLISYFPRIYPSIYKNDMNYFDAQKRLGRPVYAQFRRDTAAVLGFYAACAIVGPWRFVWLVLLPQVRARAGARAPARQRGPRPPLPRARFRRALG